MSHRPSGSIGASASSSQSTKSARTITRRDWRSASALAQRTRSPDGFEAPRQRGTARWDQASIRQFVPVGPMTPIEPMLPS
ncbi:MAG: hypothetical protein QOF27_1261 [Gaiellaceae bacterium]|nr:hypothetical protein [Gaiellaceae bacterium]